MSFVSNVCKKSIDAVSAFVILLGVALVGTAAFVVKNLKNILKIMATMISAAFYVYLYTQTAVAPTIIPQVILCLLVCSMLKLSFSGTCMSSFNDLKDKQDVSAGIMGVITLVGTVVAALAEVGIILYFAYQLYPIDATLTLIWLLIGAVTTCLNLFTVIIGRD
ncbi:hypothetical protein HNP86_001776 [Methanococcus maripaludis]|uniref:Uncharacterized protein n=1 Tax=Methanococcus maripaludis TaxID=39152 RepID=A0A7J9NWC0_METMI|nr:hypothetical protein [Methanococcus maripaludis]MBA2851617.1 hypothetical protein [Methanococcus maripaludis]